MLSSLDMMPLESIQTWEDMRERTNPPKKSRHCLVSAWAGAPQYQRTLRRSKRPYASPRFTSKCKQNHRLTNSSVYPLTLCRHKSMSALSQPPALTQQRGQIIQTLSSFTCTRITMGIFQGRARGGGGIIKAYRQTSVGANTKPRLQLGPAVINPHRY